LGGRLAQPALDGEDDGRPADHFVAGEDLVWEGQLWWRGRRGRKGMAGGGLDGDGGVFI
jgi:hypothetical protein